MSIRGKIRGMTSPRIRAALTPHIKTHVVIHDGNLYLAVSAGVALMESAVGEASARNIRLASLHVMRCWSMGSSRPVTTAASFGSCLRSLGVFT